MELTVEKLQEYKKTKKFLDEVCEKYFEVHEDDWKSYAGWQILDPNYIIIHYSYYDYRDQYESGDIVIPMDTLIEFSKRYGKDKN